MKHHRIGKGGSKVKGKKAAAILFTNGRSMLLLKRAGEGDHNGKWALPGGKGEEGETEIGTATREALEETGLDALPGYRFDQISTRDGRQKFTTFIYRVSGPFDIRLSKEHSEYKWVNFDDLDGVELHPKFRLILPELLYRIRKRTHSFVEWAAITDAIILFS